MIIENIQSHYPKLSKAQKRIANFLISNTDKACFLSLKELSEEVGTTEVTIMNFSRKIGYDNFVELKRELQAFIQSRLSPGDKLVTALTDVKDEDSKLSEIINTETVAIHKTIENLNITDLRNAVKILKNATKIYLVGENVSQIIVNFLSLRMKVLGLDVLEFNISAYDIISLQMLKVKPTDVFIITSFPKYSKKAIILTEYLKKKGNRMISITDRVTSPIARHSEVVFTCASDSVVFYNSMTAAIAVSNILVSTLALELKDALVDNTMRMKEMEQIFLEKHVNI